MKSFRPRMLALSLPERLTLAEDLLAKGIGQLSHAGIYVLALSAGDLGPEHLDYLNRVTGYFHGWSDVDYFCIDVMQPLLWRYPEEVLALHKAWATDENQWRRRSSVVTFTRKVGESGQFTDQALALCDKLKWDPEDLVQKGVGWALKDTMRGDRDKVITYVKELRRQGVPSTITLYAIRDLKGQERQAVLAVKMQR